MATDLEASDVQTAPTGANEACQETSYLFVKVLGRGAFGEAVLYRKTEDNSLVVWKEVNLARLGEKERRDAMNEVEILSLLNNTNVITYYNHFLDQDTLFIEMEYANGGSLHDKIATQTDLFPEQQVRWYLFQIASALTHIHNYGIIHRDVKAMNIFMTKTDLLKLGDFGISKLLESKGEMADSLVGTPYYLSPEIVQGASYDQKTDVWALGCVLFELLTLTKTFQATNQLRLAYEIVRSEQGEVDPCFSNHMRELVNLMLQKEPKNRPSTMDILDHSVFTADDCKANMEKQVWELNSGARKLRLQSSSSVETVPVIKSKVTEVYQWGGGKRTPQKQDMFVKGKSAIQVAAGSAHFAVVTMEKELYTWANVQGGAQIVGQLGQGNKSAYKAPKKVEALEGVGIIQASCGEDFTLAVTDEGQVHAFGSDYYGCLGCDNEDYLCYFCLDEGQVHAFGSDYYGCLGCDNEDYLYYFCLDEGQVHAFGSDYYGCLGCDNEEGDEVLVPILVDYFNTRPVAEVSCGQCHVIALTRDRDVYSWGCGEFGRLGLGSEDDFASPQKVETPGKHFIKHVYAGSDSTFLVTTSGRVLACGSNEYNKLGLNSETSGLRKQKPKIYDIPCKYTFSTVKPLLRFNIVTVSAGHTHSAAIDLYGKLYTFGSNKYGQLGVGDFKKKSWICRVSGVLTGKRVINVTCGTYFTVAATSDSQVYSWGNGANGTLGAEFLDQGKGPNSQSISLPRTLFGSLHLVSHLSARHWHTIAIAEKVLNQKTLKSRISSPKLFVPSPPVVEEDGLFLDSDDGLSKPRVCINYLGNEEMKDSGKPDSPEISESKSDWKMPPRAKPFTPSPVGGAAGYSYQDSGRPSSGGSDRPGSGGNREESNIPDWLQAELQDADFIPFPPDVLPVSPPIQHPGQPGGPSIYADMEEMKEAENSMKEQKLIKSKNTEILEKDELIALLKQKLTDVELENTELKEQLKSQEKRMKSLETQVGAARIDH
ncbi:serine/threonine-protein kinase Nek9-like isoform X2 [Mizuhopecten yessoensis]|uniref:serine/threonine-protein kinase Nek9-like isoform X2 n=1 Tax=Mizuhopecten yessoensis TaxID=6573 RepID=UPI000B45BB48|nr:serine/threonine-protein kinase Nek9-like isoform X2 [Mizuhopecten yessoensis]